MSRLWILPVLGLIAALGFACSDSGDDKPQSVSSTAPNATETPTATAKSVAATSSPTTRISPTPTIVDTLTYSDPTYGYSFEYPASWYLSPAKDNGGSVILYSYDLASIPSGEVGMPVPKSELKATFWIAEAGSESVQQWITDGDNSAAAQGLPVTIVSQSNTSLAGKQGIARATQADQTTDQSYYIPIGGGRIFVINATPADSDVWPQFSTVLATLQFES
jgi:hypothetical protein